jgi:PEP-CTERM motif
MLCLEAAVKKIFNILVVAVAMFYIQTPSAAVIQYDFVAEAVGNEGGYSAYTSDGVGSSGVFVTATASNFTGTTSYYAYLDDADVTRPAGLGACMALVSAEPSGCLVAEDDSLNNGVTGGEVLSLAWDQVVTINLITFRNGTHHSTFSSGRDFEVRVDGGVWQNFNLVHLFTTPLTGTRFDFIVDDTFGNDGCATALCGDGTGPGAALYISNITIETPEPGMVVLFLLGIGLIAFSNRQRVSI